MRGVCFFLLTLVFVISLFFLLILLFICIQVGLIGYAHERISMSAYGILPLLLLSLLGGAINIPVTKVGSDLVVSIPTISLLLNG